MNDITHPLFLIALAALASWAVSRWWYRRKLKSFEAKVIRERHLDSDFPDFQTSSAATDEPSAEDDDSRAMPRQGLLFSGTRDYRYPPFVDTSPHTHDFGDDPAPVHSPGN